MNIKSLSSGRTSPIFGRILSVSGGGGKYFYSITSLNPSLVAVGSPDTVVSIFGGIFTGTSVPYINGTPAAVYSLISPTQIDVTVPASVLTTPGVDIIRVRDSLNPTTNFSNAVLLGTAYPLPTFTNHTPASLAQGSPDTTIALTGTGFYPSGTFVNVNDAPYTFAYLTPTSGTFVFPATLAAAVGSYSITVVNPAPGGGVSAIRTLSVNPATGPTLSSISPTTENRYRSNFQLTCTGAGFTGAAVVNLDGVPLATIVDGPTQLRATVTKASNLIAGAKNITVVDVGGTSVPQVLTIAAWTPSNIVGATGRFRVRTGEMVEAPAGFIQTLTNLITPGTGNMTQATAANRPELVAADPTFNNKPSIRKNSGTLQFLSGGVYTGYVTDTTKTLLAVATADAVAAPNTIFISLNGGTHGFFAVSTTLSGFTFRAYDGAFKATATVPPAASNIPFGAPQRLKGTHDAGNIRLEVNTLVSALVAAGTSTSAQMAGALQIFNAVAAGYGARMCELVTMNTTISAPDEDCWKNYVENEYGISA